ncbi:MAG: enoyl-CoA hydratase/isomerase family protein [bacterium]|nr:enoyl-CoA hydratase/isomerase family protein [bacterium]
MTDHFLVEKAHQIATITLNRPEKRNPINVEMLKEFEAILLDLRDDAASRIVILTGSGNSFCAGADLSIVKGIDDEVEKQRIFAQARHQRIRLINRIFTMLENLEQASIAAINGYAIGGGWGLALACDFRLAVPGAQFWFPEVDLGVPLSLGTSARLFSMVGAGRAKEIIMMCSHHTSEELLSWGMLSRIVPSEQLMDAAHEVATKLLAKHPRAITGSKLTVNALTEVAAREFAHILPEVFIHSRGW